MNVNCRASLEVCVVSQASEVCKGEGTELSDQEYTQVVGSNVVAFY